MSRPPIIRESEQLVHHARLANRARAAFAEALNTAKHCRKLIESCRDNVRQCANRGPFQHPAAVAYIQDTEQELAGYLARLESLESTT